MKEDDAYHDSAVRLVSQSIEFVSKYLTCFIKKTGYFLCKSSVGERLGGGLSRREGVVHQDR